MIIALMATDLPEPVEPAISTCGIVLRSAVTMRPLMSLPSAIASLLFDCANDSHSTTSRSQIVSALMVRHLDADSRFARHALDEHGLGGHREAKVIPQGPVTREYFTPECGLNSKVVTTGPGVDLLDRAGDRRTPRTSPPARELLRGAHLRGRWCARCSGRAARRAAAYNRAPTSARWRRTSGRRPRACRSNVLVADVRRWVTASAAAQQTSPAADAARAQAVARARVPPRQRTCR